MKTNKLTIVLLSAIALTSCSQLDTFLVKNTGLTSTDAISLGLKTKERIDLTLQEYNKAKNRNLSGKDVITVTPTISYDVTPEKPKESFVDSILGSIGF